VFSLTETETFENTNTFREQIIRVVGNEKVTPLFFFFFCFVAMLSPS